MIGQAALGCHISRLTLSHPNSSTWFPQASLALWEAVAICVPVLVHGILAAWPSLPPLITVLIRTNHLCRHLVPDSHDQRPRGTKSSCPARQGAPSSVRSSATNANRSAETAYCYQEPSSKKDRKRINKHI